MRKLRHGTYLGLKLELELRWEPRLPVLSWTAPACGLTLCPPGRPPGPSWKVPWFATWCFWNEVFPGDLETSPLHLPLPHWPWILLISVKRRGLATQTPSCKETWGTWPWREWRRRTGRSSRCMGRRPHQKPQKTPVLGAWTQTPQIARPFKV